MTILEIEQAIVQRLKSKIKDLEIIGFPEKPSEYKLLHRKGAILVVYAGSTFSEPKSTDNIYQERKVEYDINLVMRHLRTHEGAYAYLDAVRLLLTGFRVNGTGKFYPVREQFLSEEAGIWQYRLTISASMPAVEAEEDEKPLLLKKITTIDEYDIIHYTKEGVTYE